ncbi:hypothetical protein BV22DRAFT_1134870 [Leucogyrophana mollusca]|uniref:Uncharacterized protein n=1 Tax=Leucogyrophana mollusca TaxID=85980 RepID=A0ACB8AXR7_9AGAM|nr:hypothetical protein BV22DRAFT_1134870 [Leucogyrophana mollusca]
MSSIPRKAFSSRSSSLVRHLPVAMQRHRSPNSSAVSVESDSRTLRASSPSCLHDPSSLVNGNGPDIDPWDESEDDNYYTDCQEAKLVLDAARAQRKVRHAEKYLADCVLERYNILTDLYRFKAEVAEKKLEDADMDTGRVRLSIKRNGLSLCPAPPRRRRRSAASTSDVVSDHHD